mmetsp:Transcript_60206/g.99431  ORF Transcript_60206/g.99431 Transcript_60206/m.99431 type:complete len:146 (+) Transcript_60206:1150-1587(+)
MGYVYGPLITEDSARHSCSTFLDPAEGGSGVPLKGSVQAVGLTVHHTSSPSKPMLPRSSTATTTGEARHPRPADGGVGWTRRHACAPLGIHSPLGRRQGSSGALDRGHRAVLSLVVADFVGWRAKETPTPSCPPRSPPETTPFLG